MKSELKIETDLPSIKIGIVIDSSETNSYNWAEYLSEDLKKELENCFPDFKWDFKTIPRHDFPRNIPKDPIELLELGSDIKIEYKFDFVLVFTTLPLRSRFEQGVNAVPSNILETAVISSSKILERYDTSMAKKALLILAKHVLGHLWGLEHKNKTVMMERKFWSPEGPDDWDEAEKIQIKEYLLSIADPRLEEMSNPIRNKCLFYIKLILREKWSLLRDIFFSKTLFMILHLGRFVTATAVSLMFLFLTAEAWEIGAAISPLYLDISIVSVIIIGTLSIYFGQNFQEIARSDKLMEQTARSKIVLIGTLISGMAIYWVILFLISLAITFVLPENILSSWAGLSETQFSYLHFAKFMATIGVFASAVGGNLEEENQIKAVLIYTEET